MGIWSTCYLDSQACYSSVHCRRSCNISGQKCLNHLQSEFFQRFFLTHFSALIQFLLAGKAFILRSNMDFYSNSLERLTINSLYLWDDGTGIGYHWGRVTSSNLICSLLQYFVVIRVKRTFRTSESVFSSPVFCFFLLLPH